MAEHLSRMIYDTHTFDFHQHSLASLRRVHNAHASAILLIQDRKVLYQLSGWPPSEGKWARYNKMIGRKGGGNVCYMRGGNLSVCLR